MQQARNASMWTEDVGIYPKFLIRDRDRKYPDIFDGFWKDIKVRPIKIPPRAPMANAFCEIFIGTLKRECLNHFMCFGKDQLDYIVRTWLRHYHKHRPHRGVGRDNSVLDENFVPKTEGQVRCRTELVGLIREYYRDAAQAASLTEDFTPNPLQTNCVLLRILAMRHPIQCRIRRRARPKSLTLVPHSA